MEELVWIKVDKNIKAIELYNFIKKELPFDTIIELYKLLQFKIINLEDEIYDYNTCKLEEIKEGNYE